MHPNYHRPQKPNLQNIDQEPIVTSPQSYNNSKFRNSFRNSCDTVNTFFTINYSNASQQGFQPRKQQIQKGKPRKSTLDRPESQVILQNVGSLNSQFQYSRSIPYNSSNQLQSHITKQGILEEQTVDLGYLRERQNQSEKQHNLQIVSKRKLRTKREVRPRVKKQSQDYYIKHLRKGNQNERIIDEQIFQHLEQSLTYLSNSYLDVPETCSPINLPCRPQDKHKKMLVIDMDQTLIYCQTEYQELAEIEIQIEEGLQGYVAIRPYALSFLKEMSQIFQIAIFTASEQSYADAVLDEIDPNGIIKHRLYRQHCLKFGRNRYTKDLRIINRDLSKILLVDNSAASFLCQPQNCIPIIPFEGGQDSELLDLQKYLLELSQQEDVRELNRKTFKLEQYRNYDDVETLLENLYGQPDKTIIDFQQQL